MSLINEYTVYQYYVYFDGYTVLKLAMHYIEVVLD